uniref:DUF1542 domain-containing protein n=1 Tax=Staphylococcus aureus TaxID=1280 RepID=UPI000AAC6792
FPSVRFIIEPNKKATARNEITTILNNKLQEIQATADATDEEKQAAETEANTENTKATQAVNVATTNAEVDKAKANAEAAINAVTPKVRKKRAALEEIDQLQVTQTQTINNEQNATNEEKEAALQQLTQAVTNAKNNINAATDNNGVDQAKDAGKNAIETTQPATAIKTNAKAEVDQAVNTQTQTIDNEQNATTEEKAAAKSLVDQAKTQAYEDILNAQTTNNVNQVKDQAVNDIQGITADTTIKDTAVQELTDKATEQNRIIDQENDSTTEEKQTATQQVNTALDTAKQNVTNANSIDEVNVAKDAGIESIEKIKPSTDTKNNARADLRTTYQNKVQAFLNDTNSTNEEKQAAIEKPREAFIIGIDGINKAKTNADVATAKMEAETKINQATVNGVKKPAAKNQLTNLADQRKVEIENTPNAQQQEIDAAKQEITDFLNVAQTEIDQANTNNDVDNAVTKATENINAVKTFGELKKDALAQIERAYNAKVTEADNSNTSTSNEIDEAKQKLAELKQQADQNINQTTAKDQLQAQLENGLSSINTYNIPSSKKETVTTELYGYADQKKNNIQADKQGTQNEKVIATNEVDEVVENTLERINNAVNNSDVDDALTQGKLAIDAVQVEAKVKPAAIKAIEDKANETIESINDSENLTKEEKAEALAEIKQIADQSKLDINNSATTTDVTAAKSRGLEAFDNIQIDSTKKQQAIEELENVLDRIEEKVDLNTDATTEEKEAFTNHLEDILSEALEDIYNQTTNDDIDTVKNQTIEKLNAQQFNPEVKKNALKAVEAAVSKQQEKINNTDSNKTAKENALNDLNSIRDRFVEDLTKTQSNAEIAELQNVTIPAIEAIVPQNDSDNNDATANSNANATPENTGQPNVPETTDNGKANASPTTPNTNNDATTGETTPSNNSSTEDANVKPTTNDNSSVDPATNGSATSNNATNNGTTDKPATETDNATPAESTTNNNSTTTATNENATTGSTATAPTKTESTETASSADSKDNASVNDSNQNAEVNNSPESQPTNGKVAQPKSENKAEAEKDDRDSTNQSMVESTTEILPSADITEPKVPSNTSKDKEESTTNQTDAEQHNSDTNVTSNEVDKSPSKADSEVSNKPSTSASSEAKDKMTTINVSQKDDMATADTKDTQTSVGSAANNKAKDMQTNDMKASLATVSNGSNSANQDMLNVTKADENKTNAKSAQQGKVNKPKQQAKTLPDTGMSHNDDLPYAELALGAGMAFLIRRFTKKDQQTEE